MIIECRTGGFFQSNTYVLAAREGGAAVVIDPGQDVAPEILDLMRARDLRCEAVLLTHGHIDHVWSAAEICEATGAPAFIHPADRSMLEDPAAALGALGLSEFRIRVPSDVRDLTDGGEFDVDGLRIEVRHAPGHSPGHCVFVTEGVAFTGDVIFQGSIGRTDFPGGSITALMDSIRRAVLTLDDSVTIRPGHGPDTTVGVERVSNPYVLADARGEISRLMGF